jgi:hypothetical protein
MAEAKGSPASNSGGAAGVGGDRVHPVVPNGYQALLASVGAPAPGAVNVGYHHQQQFYNPAGMIHAPMPGQPAPPPNAVRTPQPPPPPHCAQSSNQLIPAGQYILCIVVVAPCHPGRAC